MVSLLEWWVLWASSHRRLPTTARDLSVRRRCKWKVNTLHLHFEMDCVTFIFYLNGLRIVNLTPGYKCLIIIGDVEAVFAWWGKSNWSIREEEQFGLLRIQTNSWNRFKLVDNVGWRFLWMYCMDFECIRVTSNEAVAWICPTYVFDQNWTCILLRSKFSSTNKSRTLDKHLNVISFSLIFQDNYVRGNWNLSRKSNTERFQLRKQGSKTWLLDCNKPHIEKNNFEFSSLPHALGRPELTGALFYEQSSFLDWFLFTCTCNQLRITKKHNLCQQLGNWY